MNPNSVCRRTLKRTREGAARPVGLAVSEMNSDKTRTIYVIDDDELVRQAVNDLLSARGYLVLEAKDGEAGMSLIESEAPALIITDIMMPNRDGLETIREMKKRLPLVPILVMSGSSLGGSVNFMEFARKLGADAHIQKPFKQAAFLERVELLLQRPA